MKNIFFILIILSSSAHSSLTNNDDINFIRDFIIHEGDSSAISGLLCWKTDALVKLLKLTSIEKFSMSVVSDCKIENIKVFWNNKHLFLLDVACHNFEQCLKLLDENKFFSHPNKLLIVDSNNRFDRNYFRNISILSDSNVVVATKEDRQMMLNQYYKNRFHLDLVIENYGEWDRLSGIIDKRLHRLPSIRRRNINRTELTASLVIINNDTLNHLDDYSDKNVDTVTKANFALTNHLIDFLNGSRNFIYAKEWGFQTSEGKWVGMIGQLIENGADIGGTPLFLLPNRVEKIEYIAMTTPTISKLVFRQPRLSFISNIFTLPFQWTVWIATLFLVIISCLVLYLITSGEKHSNKNGVAISDTENQYTLYNKWGEIVLLAISAVSQQGSFAEPRALSGKITTIILYIALMFLYTSYSANIVALLQSESNNIRTLSDVLHSRIKLGAEDTPYNRFYLPRSTDPIRSAIWNKKIAPKGSKPRFLKMEDGVREMQKGLFAFQMEIGVGYKVVNDIFQEDEKCGLHEIQLLDTDYPWYAIQKNSSFKEPLKIGIRKIQEVGLQRREFQKMYSRRPICTSKSGTFISVGLVDVGTAFQWFGIGLALAIIFLIVEILTRLKHCHVNMLSV